MRWSAWGLKTQRVIPVHRDVTKPHQYEPKEHVWRVSLELRTHVKITHGEQWPFEEGVAYDLTTNNQLLPIPSPQTDESIRFIKKRPATLCFRSVCLSVRPPSRSQKLLDRFQFCLRISMWSMYERFNAVFRLTGSGPLLGSPHMGCKFYPS